MACWRRPALICRTPDQTSSPSRLRDLYLGSGIRTVPCQVQTINGINTYWSPLKQYQQVSSPLLGFAALCKSRYPPPWPMIKPWVADGPFLCLDDPREWIRYKGTLECMCALILQAKGPKVPAWRTHDTKCLLMNQTTYIYTHGRQKPI